MFLTFAASLALAATEPETDRAEPEPAADEAKTLATPDIAETGERKVTDNGNGTVTVETLLVDLSELVPDKDGSGPVLLNQQSIFTPANYPDLAWDRDVSGKVAVVVEVSAEGLPTHCETEGEPADELGGPTCALFLAQARFTPAKDKDGKDVKGTYRRVVSWVLPEEARDPVRQSTDRLTFAFAADGSVGECRHEQPDWMAEKRKAMEEREGEASDPCAMLAPVAQVLAITSPRPDWLEWELNFETWTVPGAATFWQALGEGSGEELQARHGVKLAIRPDGKVSQCEMLPVEAPVPFFQVEDSCALHRKLRFERSDGEAERILQIVSAIYFRPKQPNKTY